MRIIALDESSFGHLVKKIITLKYIARALMIDVAVLTGAHVHRRRRRQYGRSSVGIRWPPLSAFRIYIYVCNIILAVDSSVAQFYVNQ